MIEFTKVDAEVTTEPQQLPLDPEPRRKFWISPQ
jgi:hypothetical protein